MAMPSVTVIVLNRHGVPRAARANALARPIGLGIERGVAGRAVIAGGSQRDEWPRDILFGQAHRIIIAAVRCALRPYRDMAAGQVGLVETVRHDGFLLMPPLFTHPRADG